MPSFHYESLNDRGEARSGTIVAMDRSDVVRMLLSRGETATNVQVDDGAKTKRNGRAKPAPRIAHSGPTTTEGVMARAERGLLAFRSRKPSMSRSDMATLMRELATALEAGLPLMAALRTVRRQASGKAMPVILDHLIERVEAGDPLYAAAKDYGPPFDDMILGMLRAADASGEMSQIMHQLADLLERSVELRRDILGATIYPMIIFLLIGVSMIIMVTVVVPRLIEPLAGSMTLPLPTRILLGVANFIGSYWIVVVVVGLGLMIGFQMWRNVPKNQLLLDRMKLKAPVFGPLMRDVAVARFTRTLGTLTSAGLPILESLRITKHTLGNRALEQAIEAVQDQVTAGKSLADPLERSGLFPALLVQVVNLGERSGKLESMLLHSATAFDRKVNSAFKIFSKLLPPLLLLIIAPFAGFVLAAILLPLLELQSLAG